MKTEVRIKAFAAHDENVSLTIDVTTPEGITEMQLSVDMDKMGIPDGMEFEEPLAIELNKWVEAWYGDHAELPSPETLKELVEEHHYANGYTWNLLSALLADTSEESPLRLPQPTPLSSPEDQGLSESEKPALSIIWQDPKEGIIVFKVVGSDEEFDLSDYPEWVGQVYEAVSEAGQPTSRDEAVGRIHSALFKAWLEVQTIAEEELGIELDYDLYESIEYIIDNKLG